MILYTNTTTMHQELEPKILGYRNSRNIVSRTVHTDPYCTQNTHNYNTFYELCKLFYIFSLANKLGGDRPP